MLLLAFFIVVQSEIARLNLKYKSTQEDLIQMVNLLQQSHSELLETSHYEKLVQLEDRVSIQLVEKNSHLKHQGKHHDKNKKNLKHHKHHQLIAHDTEPLLDVLPLSKDEKDMIKTLKKEHSLEPITPKEESQLEHKVTKLFTTQQPFKASVPLTNLANTMFVGELNVGSNEKPFNVIFDTGSALTCIASELCKDIGCQRSNRYDRKSSQTFQEVGKKVEITFGSGTLRGLINRESLKIDGIGLKEAIFIEITEQIGDAFHEGDFDGIVGLGYPHMTGVPTLFDYMMNQHKLDKNIFTFHLNRRLGNSGSELIFGGFDSKLIEGEWVYHDVKEQFYWSIFAEEIRVGGANTNICSVDKKCKLVVDTGTTLLTGPSQDVKKLLSMIRVEPQCRNFQTMPDITFVVDNHEYVLSPEDYILTITDKGVEPPYQHSPIDQIKSCAGTIFPLDLPPKQGPLWILGDIFITKYSALFDRDNNKVGLAKAINYK